MFVVSVRSIMTFGIEMVLGAVVFSLVGSLLSHIRASRPGKTVYEVWLDEVANDNVISSRKDFSNYA